MPVVSKLKMQKQENHKFKANMGCLARFCCLCIFFWRYIHSELLKILSLKYPLPLKTNICLGVQISKNTRISENPSCYALYEDFTVSFCIWRGGQVFYETEATWERTLQNSSVNKGKLEGKRFGWSQIIQPRMQFEQESSNFNLSI